MIAIIGSEGQLGRELVDLCEQRAIVYKCLSHSNIELNNEQDIKNELSKFLAYSDPVTVINTASMHDVDMCETMPESAWKVNVNAVSTIASFCASHRFRFIHISTDYANALPLDENGLPLSVYAKSKLAGEIAALSILPSTGIFRVGTLYGKYGCRAKGGGNFIDTIVGKIKDQKKFTIVDYNKLIPTYAKHAAIRILNNLDKSGVYYANDDYGESSSYSIGCTLASKLNLPNLIQAVSIDPTDKIRPKNILYNRSKWLPLSNNSYSDGSFKDPLEEYLIEKGHK